MSYSRHQHLTDLFLKLCDLAPEEREEELDRACGDDPELRAELESLLRYDEAVSRDAEKMSAARRDPRLGPSARLGQYRIVEVLADGGMGIIYRAEQERPRRQVALKVLKPGMASAEAIRRFHCEAEVLGRLHHPGIAQIFESDTFDAGSGPQPFFAMELVHGWPVTDYARRQQLDTRQCLEILAKVCDAVHHAHQKGVIHRDLKPWNILVDETGQPKILDFGIARVIEPEIDISSDHTAPGRLLGTLPYMSPEQAAGEADLDTRADVYSLGLVAYELLTGHFPYDLKGKMLYQALHTIIDEEPRPLGERDKRLRGDIEAIVHKALQKQRDSRYASAAALAQDIRLFLSDEPVSARSPTTFYQLTKFARKHRLLVYSLSAVAAGLLLGLSAATLFFVMAGREHLAASRAYDAFLHAIFMRAGAEVPLGEALERSLGFIEEYDELPLAQAGLHKTAGQFFVNHRRFAAGEAELERALKLFAENLPPGDPALLQTRYTSALSVFYQGRYGEAENLLRELLEDHGESLGALHAETLTVKSSLVDVLKDYGRLDEAERLGHETLSDREQKLGPDYWGTFSSANILAGVWAVQGKLEDSYELQRKTLSRRAELFGAQNPSTLTSKHNLAWVQFLRGEVQEAEDIMRAALDDRRRVLGENHQETLQSMSRYAVILAKRGSPEEAERLMRDCIELQTCALERWHPDTLDSISDLAMIVLELGRMEQAEGLLREALSRAQEALGTHHWKVLLWRARWACCMSELGRCEEVAGEIESSCEALRNLLGEDHYATREARGHLDHVRQLRLEDCSEEGSPQRGGQ
ncbi:MAG: tetratricopeptide repeat protein [Planctomycetota bacterium]